MERPHLRQQAKNAEEMAGSEAESWSFAHPATLTLTSFDGDPMGTIHLPDARLVSWSGGETCKPKGKFGVIHDVHSWNGSKPPIAWVTKEFLPTSEHKIVGREMANMRLLAADQKRGALTTGVVQAIGIASGHVHDPDEHNDRPFRGVVMARAPGIELFELIERQTPVKQLLRAVAEAGRMVSELHHAGYNHGDLKPANLMADRWESAKPIITVVDVGSMAEAKKKIDGEYGFTPGYSLVAHRYPTRLGDVYALGSTAYLIATGFLLSGQPANDREEIPGVLPAGLLRDLMLATCAPQSQSISAKQFAEHLDAAIAAMPDA